MFDKEHPDSYWEWKYSSPPLKPLVLVWEENEQILGHIALWVMPAYIEGRSSKIGLRMDTMVDPEARGKGIYNYLNQDMLQRAEAENIAMLYGFPSPAANSRLLKYTNASHQVNISRRVLYAPARLKRGRNKTDVWKLTFKPVADCGPEFNELASQNKDQWPVHVKKQADFLNWRYLQHPVNSYNMTACYMEGKLRGYVVTKKEKKKVKGLPIGIGSIVDISAGTAEESEALAREAVHELKSCLVVQTWTLPHSALADSLQHLGFREKDQPLPFVTHNLSSSPSLDDPSNWFITQGDVDSF
ncbi:GNAT family N-acetyltransferase [Sinobaca sp. H24]|uniref:GNAT family N-acetyltransferase n=1 Tax=Sinobaca sp. H24 TaxID=2923376 RepID=UPI00207929B9|nr:GNAT family N-acetyltransferase [Sinobaca sp. H24]